MSEKTSTTSGLRNRQTQNKPKSTFRKRDPPKPSNKKTDIYVTNKSNFKYHLERIEKLWIEGEKEIDIRALGAAIQRAINLCLQFQQQHFNLLHLDVTTDSVNLIDDAVPQTEDDDFETRSRRNSSIHIRIRRREDFAIDKSKCSSP